MEQLFIHEGVSRIGNFRVMVDCCHGPCQRNDTIKQIQDGPPSSMPVSSTLSVGFICRHRQARSGYWGSGTRGLAKYSGTPG
jgi:hypothetical protein